MHVKFTKPTFAKGVDPRPEIHALKKLITEMLVVFDEAHGRRRLEAKGIKTRHDSANQRERALGSLAESTTKAYERRANGLLRFAELNQRDVWEAVEGKSKTLGSWRAASAALKFVLPRRIRDAKNKLDELERTAGSRSGPSNFLHQLDCALIDMCCYANMLQSTPTTCPDRFLPKPDRKLGASKKYSLKGLPTDWDRAIGDSLAAERKLPATSLSTRDAQLLWLVQCITGCRTQELTLGVQVRVALDGTHLQTVVNGAKCGMHAGQTKRALTLLAGTGLDRTLIEMLGVGASQVVQLQPCHMEAYRRRVSRMGAKLTPQRPAIRQPSAYTARHTFKTKLVSAGVGRVDIAKAMGHRSTKSSRYYGGGGKAGGAVKPLQIQATETVKVRAPYKSSKVASVNSDDISSSRPNKSFKATR